MSNRRILLDLAIQYPEYRAPLVRVAANVTGYSNVPSPEEVESTISGAGQMDGVDPAVADFITQTGLMDGQPNDDVVSTGKVSPMATSLHPSQKTMILAKAIGMALGMLKSGKIGGDLGAIISKDNHILDGHHRWAATILAGGSKGKVGGYAAGLPGKDLLKVLNLISKGMFKVRNGNPGKGAISDFKPGNVRNMLGEFTEKGIGGDHPWTAEGVKDTLTKAFGSVEAGIDQMAKNVMLMSKKVPGWAPDRKQMPVIHPSKVPEAAKALNEGIVDFSRPHATPNKVAGHHQGSDGKWYVDTAFINKCQRVSGVSVHHMGFGEFYAETPKGRVDFDKMRGKKFEGQSGRSHEMYGDGADWLVKQVEKGGHSDRMAGDKDREAAIRWTKKIIQKLQRDVKKKRLDDVIGAPQTLLTALSTYIVSEGDRSGSKLLKSLRDKIWDNAPWEDPDPDWSAIARAAKGLKAAMPAFTSSFDMTGAGISQAAPLAKPLADLLTSLGMTGEARAAIGAFRTASTRMASTRTAGRHERGLSPRTLDWLVEGAADSAEIDNSRDAEATPAVKALAKKYERDLEKAMEEWHRKNPDALIEDMEVDDLLDDGAAYLVLMTLRGEGVGIWDGDWDHYFVDGDRGIKVLGRLLEQKLGQYADDTGGGSINEALEEAAYETTGSMDKYAASSKALDKVYAMSDMLGEVRRGIQAQGHHARSIPEFVVVQKGLLALEKAVGSLAKKASMGDTDARAARIRLASTLPVGSGERKAILAGLQKTSGQRALDKARDEIKNARYQY